MRRIQVAEGHERHTTGERMQIIAAGTLVLEPLTAAHAEAMFEVLSDPELYQFLDYPPPASIEQLRRDYERLESRQSPDGGERWLNWVVRRPGEPPLGYVQATVTGHDSAWIAYVLSSAHWGQGHAHAAMHAMLEHLGATYGVQRFLATVEVENHRSIRLLERLAFHPGGANEVDNHDLSATELLFVR